MENNLKCSECEVLGMKSKIYIQSQYRTCIGYIPYYWDEDGKLHVREDPNETIVKYKCTNNHEWSKTYP